MPFEYGEEYLRQNEITLAEMKKGMSPAAVALAEQMARDMIEEQKMQNGPDDAEALTEYNAEQERAKQMQPRPRWFMDAEYQIVDRHADWNNPIQKTIRWHGPYWNDKEFNEAMSSVAWSKIDLAYHRCRELILEEWPETITGPTGSDAA